jgi:hypothetical protein
LFVNFSAASVVITIFCPPTCAVSFFFSLFEFTKNYVWKVEVKALKHALA